MPRNANHPIPLDPKMDKNEQMYYVGKANSPTKIPFDKGAVIFVFLAEEGAEEIQIGLPKKNSAFDPIKKRLTDDGPQYIIPLKAKEDQFGKKYFFALVQDDKLELDLREDDGYVFFVFASEPGKETLQISKNKESYRDKVRDFASRQSHGTNVEVVRRKAASESDDNYAVHTPRFGTG